MNLHPKFFLVFILLILIISPSLEIQAGAKPVLYGKVFLKTTSGLRFLREAKIELLDVKKEKKLPKVLFKTYTDSYGNFAFYKIPQRDYYLRILLGKKVLSQLVEDKKIKLRLVNVTNKSKKLPDIIVLPEQNINTD